MRLWAQVLLGLTLAMLALHLVTYFVLRHVSAKALVRAEAAYYLVLIAYVALARRGDLVLAAVVLGAIHWAAWIIAERRAAWVAEGIVQAPRALIALQVFDWAEAVALAFVAWRLLAK